MNCSGCAKKVWRDLAAKNHCRHRPCAAAPPQLQRPITRHHASRKSFDRCARNVRIAQRRGSVDRETTATGTNAGRSALVAGRVKRAEWGVGNGEWEWRNDRSQGTGVRSQSDFTFAFRVPLIVIVHRSQPALEAISACPSAQENPRKNQRRWPNMGTFWACRRLPLGRSWISLTSNLGGTPVTMTSAQCHYAEGVKFQSPGSLRSGAPRVYEHPSIIQR